MSGLFSNYSFIVLDASFFAGKFSMELRDELMHSRVFVSETFNSEVAQYMDILPPQRRDAYRENIAILQQRKPLERLRLSNYADDQHCDTLGTVMAFHKANMKAVLVTADQLLMQRIILSGPAVDIYDLNQSIFLYSSDFSSLACSLLLEKDAQWGLEKHCAQPVAPGKVLYRKNGTSVTLGNEIGEGLEAHLFLLNNDSRYIAKIFKQDRLPPEKYHNIVNIQGSNYMLDIDWALFPIDVVYYDVACTQPAGFTEGFGKTYAKLEANPLYLGNLDLPNEILSSRISDTLELCIKVVRQVRYLSSYGFLISDFNKGNFSLQQSNSGNIQMWDTDSFGYLSYFSGYYSGSRTSREYDIQTKKGAIGFCADSLYLFIFNLLSLGVDPISETKGTFKFDNPKFQGGFRKNFFPENLWKLFETVFRCQKEPSVEMLLHELHLALHQYRTSSSLNKSYRDLLGGIITEPSPPVPEEVSPGYTPSSKPLTQTSITQSNSQNLTSAGSYGGTEIGTQTGGSSTHIEQNKHSSSGYEMPAWLRFFLIFCGSLLACYLVSRF